jgi:F-type H+-transporting ATPase subunit b
LQETAKLESEAFVQQQKVALASEVKAVLDSWVRYEQQVKESEQADLSRTVIEKVLASIKDEKMQRDVLASAVAEVERKLAELWHKIFPIADDVIFRHLELVKNKAI